MWPLPDRKIATREFERLLLRVPNWLGDQVMATAAIAAVRARYAATRITGLGAESARLLYAGAGWFDDFLVAKNRDNPLHLAGRLRPLRFDACLLLAGSFRSALPPFLARIPHRIGYRRSGRTPLLTAHWARPRPEGKRAPYPTKRFYLDLVEKLGARGGGRVRLGFDEGSREMCEGWMRKRHIRPEEPILAMCVGAAFGPSKLWPAAYFAQVADEMVRRHGARVVLLCGPGEERIGAEVRTLAHSSLVDTGLAPLPLDLLKAVIARSRVLLTNDTGPRHIATAFHVPVVCLMGPTDPTYTDSDMSGQVVLRADGVACSPCHLKVCPIDHRCMVWIRPEEALAAVESAWNSPPADRIALLQESP